jgi:hypothetical protein
MENQDEYIVKVIEKYLCYFKNGKLHRENGPAFYIVEEKSKYFNLGDENLYQQEDSIKLQWAQLMRFMLHYANGDEPGYALEGIKYDKAVWESIIEKKQLKKELSSDLPQIKIETKKPKI